MQATDYEAFQTRRERIPCDCCGTWTVRIGGDMFLAGEAPASLAQLEAEGLGGFALYAASWSEADPFNPDHPARFSVFFFLEDEVEREDRSIYEAEMIAFREDGRVSVSVVDAAPKPEGSSTVPLAREDVVGTEVAPFVFAVLDSVFLTDPAVLAISSPG